METEFTQQVLLAWRRELDLLGLCNAAASLQSAGQPELAAVLYQTWLSRNQTTANHLALFNLGVLLDSLGDLDGAKNAYLQAVSLAPAFMQPHFNLGTIYERAGRIEQALAHWRAIAGMGPGQLDDRDIRLLALNNLGRVYELQYRYAEAMDSMLASVALKPDQPDVLHHLIFLRAKTCNWPVYTALPGVGPELMRDATSALAMIALSDDPEDQLRAARRYVSEKLDLNVPQLAARKSYGHARPRIGYLSSNLNMHAISLLMVELFENHDHQKFEIFAFCWSPEDGTQLRQRVVGAMDRIERIGALSDDAAAELIREHEIDILVDLQGQTSGARAGILARRPAPIQITYLGLPATTGFPFIDYVIVDHFLVPEECRKYYSEQPLYMPDVYQCSDRKRISSAPPTRQACGLPEGAFVYCSFNNNYKITPEVFASWMRILQRTPGSVLWLLADNTWAEANMRRAAAEAGIDGGRLIFAPRAQPPDYLARFEAADLFLDTYPFNAGTTANDVLWMGLPVLTRSGLSFASRMAGALLTAAGLPELITYDLAAYEEKAVALAGDPTGYRALRERLKQARTGSALFDTTRFARNLEQQYQRLVSELQV